MHRHPLRCTDRSTADTDVDRAAAIADAVKALQGANLTLMFFLEIGVYTGVVAWAVREHAHMLMRTGLAVGGVVALGVCWGLFAAPRASYPLEGLPRAAFEIAWFGVGVLALRATGLTSLAVLLGVLYVGNGALRLLWDQV